MSDAKARAAARREAILAKKSDRLAKFKTTAKEEGAGASDSATDGTQYPDLCSWFPLSSILRCLVIACMRWTDPPLAELPSLDSSPAEHPRHTSGMTTASYSERHASPSLPSVRSNRNDARRQQQERFLRAIARESREPTPTAFDLPSVNYSTRAPSADIPDLFADTPLAGFLRDRSPFTQIPDMVSPMDAPSASTSKAWWNKLFPLIHALSTLCFLLYFVFRYSAPHNGVTNTEHEHPVGGPSTEAETLLVLNPWRRWAELARGRPQVGWDSEPKVFPAPFTVPFSVAN